MTTTEQLQPLISLLERNKKVSNQEIMQVMNTDNWGLQTIRNILIDGENVLDDDFTGIRLRTPDKVGLLGKILGKKPLPVPINPQYDVFISYSRKNLDFVRKLIEKIQLHQKKNALQPLRIFFDKTEIKLGEDWTSKLMQGLKNTTAMLVNVSPEYFQSFYCKWEWQKFIEFEPEKKMVRQSISWVYINDSPDFDDNTHTNDWHLELKARQYLDLRPFKKPNTNEVKEMYDAITRVIQKAELVKQPTQNNIPQLNFRTLARTEFHASLDRLLWFAPQNKYTAVVLTGENGVGKTTLAYNYAKANSHKYEGGIFVIENANLMTDLVDFSPFMLQTLGVEMTITDREDRAWMRQKLNEELRSRGQMLWILDNVQGFEWLKNPERLRNQFPTEAKIHWLITTTVHPGIVLKAEFTSLPVGNFSAYEAMSYLTSYQPATTEAQKQQIEELLRFIGLKPINVMVLGSMLYLRQNNDNAPDIEQLINQTPNIKDLLAGVVAQLPAIEQRILALVPLMPNDALLIEWLFEFDTWLNESKRGIKKTTWEEWQLATEHLLGLGFLSHTENERIKSINPTLLKYIENQVVIQLQEVFYQFLARKVQTNTDYRNLPIFAQYFIKTIPTQSLLKVDIVHNLISKLSHYSFHNLAIELINLLLSHFQKLSPYNLGYTYYLKSFVLNVNEQYHLALIQIEHCIAQALKIKREDLKAGGYDQKSRILERLERYAEALDWINLSIDIKEKNNPAKNTDSLAFGYHEKSRIFESLERYAEALGWINLSIDIKEKNNPAKNTDSLAVIYHEKSSILQSLERYAEALDWINLSIDIKEKNNPAKNTDSLAFSYHEKSSILESLERYAEALDWINLSIDIKEKNNPEKNTDSLAFGYHEKSRILERLERYAEALDWINLSIDIKEKNNPAKNTDSLSNSYHQKSRIFESLERYAEALGWINLSIDIKEKNNP
nr:tetratricopeptide repeat protein [Arcicella sp.]